MARKKAEIISLANSGATITLNKAEMKLFLPHRRKALKLDGVNFCQTNETCIIGFKKIGEKDPDLDGHFDTKPVYPGVSIAECANLAAAMLILLTNENLIGYPTVVDFHCKCKRPVYPGDDITIDVDLVKKEQHRGQAFYSFFYVVNKQLPNGHIKAVADGTITGTAT